MPRWSQDDIAWDSFDSTRLSRGTLQVVKAAALTEYNAARYTRYLENVFEDDEAFRAMAHEWQLEEEQHGRVLGRYSELAEPGYDFAAAFKRFTDGYVIPVDVSRSIRGSRVGELVARCVVETGTSSFYSAIADSTEEPLLKAICKRIAADEFRHYRTFLDGVKRFQPLERVSTLRRLIVAVGRMREADDDELAFAFHAANDGPEAVYEHARCNAAYGAQAYGLYRYHHVERAVGMVLKASGLKPNGWLGRQAAALAWRSMQGRARRKSKLRPD